MTVKQISVFVENKPGMLAALADVLNENGINMRALSLAETKDFGIIRLILDDPFVNLDEEKIERVLKESGYVCSITKVLAIAISNQPGSLGKVMKIFGENEINVEYTYAFTSGVKDKACMILRVGDNEKAVQALTKNGIKPLCQDDLDQLYK